MLKTRGETAEQIRLFAWAKHHEDFIPELKLLHHIPNEGKRTRSEGGRMKAAGLKPGMPDICLPVPRHGFSALYIELKYGRGTTSKVQEEMIEELRAAGNAVRVCYGFEEAREAIRHYLARSPGFDLVNCEEANKVFDKCAGWDFEFAPCKECAVYAERRGI